MLNVQRYNGNAAQFMRSQVDFANISNNRIALQHVVSKYVPNIWRLLTGKTPEIRPEKNSSGCYANVEILKKDGFSQHNG